MSAAVVTHPGVRKIPKCKLQLHTSEGKREYDTYARVLFDAGRFDTASHVELSIYAACMDEITKRKDKGELVMTSLLDRMTRSFRALHIDDLSQQIAGPEDQAVSRFAKFGAPARRRLALSEGDIRP